MSLSLASIHLYPIKSLGGFEVAQARLTDRGLQHDRRWMLVDEDDRFVSQREIATMACLHCTPHDYGFRVTDIRSGATLDMPWQFAEGAECSVIVWDDRMTALEADGSFSAWFCERLGRTLRLVYMPERSERAVDRTYAEGITSFSDGFPYLIISQASLDDLNDRIPHTERIPMDRFRPNLVIAGGSAFQEDGWERITIDGVNFELVKPCSRCMITTTDQRSGERSKEPLRTLAKYRSGLSVARNGKVDFGMNAMAEHKGVITKNGVVTIFGSR